MERQGRARWFGKWKDLRKGVGSGDRLNFEELLKTRRTVESSAVKRTVWDDPTRVLRMVEVVVVVKEKW